MFYLYFFIYYFFINFLGFLFMYIDKRKAIKNTYRISEKTFFIISLLLGAIGTHIGMYKFRHKTKHLSFIIFIPALIILNIVTIYYLFNNIETIISITINYFL